MGVDVEIPFVWTEVALVAIWVLVRGIKCLARGRIDWKQELIGLLMLVNLMVIVRFTMFPFWRLNGEVRPLLFNPDKILPFRMNLLPLYNIFWTYIDIEMLINVFGNILLFVPTGAILPIVYPKLDSYGKVMRVAALMSLTIEVVQLLFYTRTTDVDDFILNMLGVTIGYIIFYWARGKIRAKAQAKDRESIPA